VAHAHPQQGLRLAPRGGLTRIASGAPPWAGPCAPGPRRDPGQRPAERPRPPPSRAHHRPPRPTLRQSVPLPLTGPHLSVRQIHFQALSVVIGPHFQSAVRNEQARQRLIERLSRTGARDSYHAYLRSALAWLDGRIDPPPFARPNPHGRRVVGMTSLGVCITLSLAYSLGFWLMGWVAGAPAPGAGLGARVAAAPPGGRDVRRDRRVLLVVCLAPGPVGEVGWRALRPAGAFWETPASRVFTGQAFF
jgi:hypothetical protein